MQHGVNIEFVRKEYYVYDFSAKLRARNKIKNE